MFVYIVLTLHPSLLFILYYIFIPLTHHFCEIYSLSIFFYFKSSFGIQFGQKMRGFEFIFLLRLCKKGAVTRFCATAPLSEDEIGLGFAASPSKAHPEPAEENFIGEIGTIPLHRTHFHITKQTTKPP